MVGCAAATAIAIKAPAPFGLDIDAEPGLFDKLQLALVISALIVDALVLAAITGRITEWGSTPNKSRPSARTSSC